MVRRRGSVERCSTKNGEKDDKASITTKYFPRVISSLLGEGDKYVLFGCEGKDDLC
jgi:hypothetical protein